MAGPDDPEHALALSYAPHAARSALAALFALDARLGAILQATRDPMIGQLRLTWWHDALAALDDGPPPAEPVLVDLAAQVLPRGIAGAELALLVEGWEALLDDDVERYADARGARLFSLAARLLGSEDAAVATAGKGWALAALASRSREWEAADRARMLAAARLDAAMARRWSRPGRTLGALTLIARFSLDAAAPAPAHPRRIARLAWHRLTGR